MLQCKFCWHFTQIFDVCSIVDLAFPVSIETILSKVNELQIWNTSFDGDITTLNIQRLHQILAGNSDRVQSSVRHDIGFLTPSGNHRRLTMWISEQSTPEADAQQVLGVYTGADRSRSIGSALVKVGQGILSYPLRSSLKADVALLGHPFDCRLIIEAGYFD